MATIDIFDTGYFYADGGAMFGAIPKTTDSSDSATSKICLRRGACNRKILPMLY